MNITNECPRKPWKKWGVLSPPVFSSDTHYKQLAMSILTGMNFRDDDRYGPILPVGQAKDVVRWAGYLVHDDK